MLDTTTKKRIDDIRDILVGKVTNPIQQVEQITVALIYKFMDDMDLEAVELGGERKFFSHEYEKYAWSNLFKSDIGGEERVELYSDALVKMELNPHIPQLFRNIFKRAFLPYRDTETLWNFLKYINDFNYSHSEKLGDAFEYLLSILGSQGDAGQFRTPRHIIDFMAAMIDPQKGESILDPACGTAGFLISAYKHILKINSANYDPQKDKHAFELHGIKLEEMSVNGKHYKGDRLTPDERKLITTNVRGYDISPDMVRLSLVNMYLHGFSEPHIYEYDTLTSDDRWNEYYDVILANPPFMSPKGGIRPHKRFSVQSKRSEVLFVDYMAEHLTANGRAAIIVPEGIIFQTGTAYKSLRKMLVDENFLVGVISLPAGVFNPYSGVKTSILWLDKALARKTDSILFVKIENDGFDLGAQRRPIKENDLPEAFQKISTYRDALRRNETIVYENDPIVSIVSKKEIRGNGDYNLSGERYRDQIIINTDFPIVNISEVAEVIAGQSPKGEFYNDIRKGLPFYQGKTEFQKSNIGSPKKWTTQITREAFVGDILMSVRAPVGPVNYATQHCCIGRGLAAIRVNNKILPSFLFNLLKVQENNIKGSGGAVFDNINKKQIETFQIPLPPLSVQEEIVAEIESYQQIIDGARQVVDNYKPHIEIDPEWEMVELGNFVKTQTGGTPSKKKDKFWHGEIPWVSPKDMKVDFIDDAEDHITEEAIENSSAKIVGSGKLLIVVRSGILKHSIPIALTTKPVSFNQDIISIESTSLDSLLPEFLFYYLKSTTKEHLKNGIKPGVTVQSFHNGYFKKLLLPLPNIEKQQQIIARIEREQSLVNANKQLIEIYEQKIKDRIEKVWGE